jgi:hypothetical protein
MASTLDVEICLTWRSRCATHRDRQFIAGIDPQRDRLGPFDLAPLVAAEGGMPGDVMRLADRVVLAGRSDDDVRNSSLQGWRHAGPLPGRHYPRGLLNELPRRDLRPFRVLGVEAASVRADFNPPLAGIECAVDAAVVGATVNESPESQPRQHADLFLYSGPGMQAALPDADTDFFTGTPFARADEADDARFYERERLVDHIDAPTRTELARIYRRFLRPGMAVLDLMASWNSHLPDSLDLDVTGLGMNESELGHNPRLARRLMHDLNQSPEIPLPSSGLDAALCALSIEYLTRPLDVMREVARTLKPGAPFVIAFSDRWFPPKAIRLWSELHPFERMALVADYLRLSGMFDRIETESLRGLPPPGGGHHRPFADPLFVVAGYRVT